MNDRSSWPELRRVLLEETEPSPGMEQRVLSLGQRAPAGRRPAWALGAVAVALGILIVATLLLTGRLLQRAPAPAAPTVPPPAVSMRALSAARLADDGTGWVLELAQQPPIPGDVTVARTTDGGAHWTSQLDLGGGFAQLRTGPGDQALVYDMGVGTGTGASARPPQPFFASTGDGGAHWQRYPTPTTGLVLTVSLADGREAWLIADVATSPGAIPDQWVVYHTADGARTWQREATIDLAATFGASNFGFGLAFDGPRGALIPQVRGAPPQRLYTTSDGGAHWQSAPLPGPGSAVPVVRLLPDGTLGLTRQRSLYVSHDGGLQWSEARSLPTSAGSLSGLNGAHWWWIAPDGGVFFSRTEGAAWTRVGSLPTGMTPVTGVFSSPTDGIMIASYLRRGAANVLLATADGGRTWRSIAPPHPFRPAVPCLVGATATRHVHLSVSFNGKVQPLAVPAGVGTTDGCRYLLYTTDASGTIDIATDRIYTLGDFLDVWGAPDVQSIAPASGSGIDLSVLVNGRPYQGDPRTIPLRDGTDILVRVIGPAVAP